ncbi:MAG: hypothetical protein K6B67_04695 [Lachnospiraceae bacterium]|nr:hypothetical protein [Lachnospiraceae bacterium]
MKRILKKILLIDSKFKNYIYMLLMMDVVTFITNYRGWVRSYNTTMLALSYEYGFTSRSLLGTLYHGLDKIIPVDMFQYNNAMIFANIITAVFVLYLVYFSYLCLNKNPENVSGKTIMVQEYILLIFNIAVVATFTYAYNFLRVDFCMIWMTLLAFTALMNEKTRWLSLPFAALGVMFHQGYVLMYFNVILIIQFYFWMTEKKKKNAILFFSTFIIGSALFLWFELFSRTNGAEIYDTVLREATNVSYNGIYHTTLLYHEVLGIDVSGAEIEFVYMNHVQLMIYLLIIAPVIIMLEKLFVNLVKQAEDLREKLKYLAMGLGSLTIMPDLLLKIDYGRWIMSVEAYYLLVILASILLRDELMINAIEKIYDGIKKRPWILLYFTLVVLIVPYMDVDVDMIAKGLQRWTQNHGILFY